MRSMRLVREIVAARRSAAIEGVNVGEKLPDFLHPARLSKTERIELAATLSRRSSSRNGARKS